jgi:L1 cell adhesion molecule like protein
LIGFGVDLGTTHSRIAVFRNDGVEVIANDQGNRSMSSYIAFRDIDCLIGESAKDQISINLQNTIFNANQLVGRRIFGDGLQADMKNCPFKFGACGYISETFQLYLNNQRQYRKSKNPSRSRASNGSIFVS